MVSTFNNQFPRSGTYPITRVNTIPNDGIIRYLGIFNSERLIVTTPKGLSEVLTTKNYDFVKPTQIVRGIGRLLGYGVLLAEGDEHKKQRKNLMPAFAFRHIKDLYPVFWQKSSEAVIAMTQHIKAGGLNQEAMGKVVKNDELDQGEVVIEAGEWSSRATLDIIGVAGMGKDFGAIKDPNTVLNTTYRTVFKHSRQAAFLGFLNLFIPSWLVRLIPIKRNGEIEEAVSVIRTVCRQLIREKKEKLDKNQLTDVDILSVALESGGFTEENLIDQIMTFLAAGHETTATAMLWAIYMLSLHPDIQTRLREEIRENLPSPGEGTALTSHDIDHMHYLNAVCSEVLRYFPPVPITLRDAGHDTTILGQYIPKGTRIMLVPWATNRQNDLWGENAAKFDPDRWLPSEKNPQSANGGAPSNYAFLTFLHGPRSCIGQGFAKAEFAVLLAAWIGRFEFRLNDERERDERLLDIKGGATAKPAKGLHVRAKIVEGW